MSTHRFSGRLGIALVVVASGWVGIANREVQAQGSRRNTDESQVPAYTLPDPLVDASGTPIKTPEAWKARRRELLELFATNVYGRTPTPPTPIVARAEILEESANALGGKAVRRQIRIHFNDKADGPAMDLLLYLPRDRAATGRVPVFLALNFQGNHSISHDPGIPISTRWIRNNASAGVVDNKATEAARGKAASRWPIENILARGYALATIYYGDIDPDFDDGFKNGIHPLFRLPGQEKPRPDEWGSIGAWAWGLSRALDYLETAPGIDASRAIVMGHSRLGKTALWAAAQDPRFAIAISNCSGCGGAALSKRRFGETVEQINRNFPHWFCDNFNRFNDREQDLPIDQHELIALIAPRPVLVCSAESDLHADPKGEFLSALGADSVYRLLGTDGLATATMPKPALDLLIRSTIGYRYRPGKHDVTTEDWNAYMDFADRHLRGR
jgi:hypothetical protein